VYATRDYHPELHCSFKSQGGIWPPHCVQGTWGVEFHTDLRFPKNFIEIRKAFAPDEDSYSGFDGTDLAKRLRLDGVEHLYIGGLATDYCVKSTVLDAIKEGFSVTVFEDAIRAVNVQPDDGSKAIQDMKDAGAAFVNSTEVQALTDKSALIVIDAQNDFFPPDGALPVPEGDHVLKPLNQFIDTWVK